PCPSESSAGGCAAASVGESSGAKSERTAQAPRPATAVRGRIGRVCMNDSCIRLWLHLPSHDPKEADRRVSEGAGSTRSEEHTSELQSRFDLVCRLLLEKKKKRK